MGVKRHEKFLGIKEDNRDLNFSILKIGLKVGLMVDCNVRNEDLRVWSWRKWKVKRKFEDSFLNYHSLVQPITWPSGLNKCFKWMSVWEVIGTNS